MHGRERIKAVGRQVYRSIPFKTPIFELARQTVRLPERLYRHLHFTGPFTVSIDEQHRFRVISHGTFVENELFWAGFGKSWEAISLQVWARLCRDQRSTIIDIGANTGIYALAAKSLAPNARVIAIEPVSRVAAKLRANVALNNGDIVVIEKAVSDHSGTMMLSDLPGDHNYSASLEGQGPNAVEYPVETCALDDLLGADRPEIVGPIKIDIERHEPAAIRGMGETLRRYRPPILIEVLDAWIGSEIESGLRGLGYDYFHIDEDNGLVPATHLAPLRDQHWNHLLCTPADFERCGLAALLAG
jgi:FkbM family methyltransferase